MATRSITTVILSFPKIEREFTYEFPYDLSRDREQEAYQTFYVQEADRLFALYGYAPMDVIIQADFREVARYRSCYQETLWHSFFREGGESWHGRFQQFTLSLIEFRWREDEREYREKNVELKAA